MPDPASAITDHIEVLGTGVVHVTPDVLQAQLGAEAIAADVAAALDRARSAADSMIAMLKQRGVAAQDMQTSEMSVGSHREVIADPDVLRAWLGIRVYLRDLVTAGDLLAAVLTAGGAEARMQYAGLAVSDPSEAMVTARDEAFADARAQAEQLAALADRQLGVVRRVSTVSGSPVPLGGWMEQEQARRKMALSIEPGSSSVSASLLVRFELR